MIRSSSTILFIALLLSACMFSRPESVQNLVEDFNLGWQGNSKYQSLYLNIDHKEYGGLQVIEETVFAVAWNQDFIVALQYPNLSGIRQRILSRPLDGGYEIENSKDIPFLEERYISKSKEKFLYDTSGLEALNNLFPYRQDTVFYLIDIRDYSRRFWGPKDHLLRFETNAEFQQGKQRLGVPEMELNIVYPQSE